ncbi:hypothetical protein DPMN_065451 [Dreissena polymorpha]|uniref:Pacifastin domain-containing protein n=1 Tax=Dreissena polymorpha TaxID=45954 RepID=A0A9D3YTK8_DREPO|nr:hypothetical protein DPMN_065451 [Dreissena polymorpha]
MLYFEGKFADPSDRCNDCECFLDGNYTCSKRVCPAVNCPVEKRMYRWVRAFNSS